MIILKILIDGDSCPVIPEVLGIAEKMDIDVLVFRSLAHFSNDFPKGKIIYVDDTPQSVDIQLANRVKAGDVVVTGDYGLAALVIGRGAGAITPRGRILDKHNIDQALLKRHLGAKIRRMGGRIKGPSKILTEDIDRFK
ncbi:MAG: hypothetical protein GX318_05135, partial [Clostridia bacterium]|nr:hypothetical protein [Clostridia bacterium]